MEYKQRFDLDDIYSLLRTEGIVNADERKLIIDNMNNLPPGEIIKLIKYMKNIRSVEYLKRNIIPNLKHIQEDKYEEQEIGD